MSEPNLRRLRATRKKPDAGQVFVMIPGNEYLFGRVMGADLMGPSAPMPGSYLIYVYRHRSKNKDIPEASHIARSELLLPPLFINRMPWTKGYFEPVANLPLRADDFLSRHCFWHGGRAHYVDENGNRLPGESYPCGDWGLNSYRSFDDEISDALRIPRAP